MESISPLQLHDRPVQEQQMEMESDDIQDQEQPSPPSSTPPPISPTREQQQICLTACAPSDAHLSELDDDDEEAEGGFPTRRHPHNYPYSSGSSPVSSFRMAVRQSRAPSTCGKFNQSLLGGLTTDAERLKSSLCVCTSIRPKHSWDVADDEDEGETATSEIFPVKKKAVTDEYKISHEIIGIGESGKVMASYHKRSGEKYALKVLRDSPRSRREIELHWLACRQPNVVSIVDIFENTFDALNCMLVVVEFMQGGDLLTLFESNGRNPYSEQCVARIVRQCGSAVQFLHERNVAHRDIKLENILCSTTNVNQCDFKLADFGFAKRSEPDRLMNSPCCTPAYVCPEILSYREYDKGCDIWALGVATYILLCGYPPFYSMQGLPFSPGMRKRITSGMFAFPAEDWDGVSASTKHMIRLMLRTDPTERITIQQLMTSDFLNLDPSALVVKHPAHLQSLPPVPSDSSLSSDAGFESTDSKDSGYEFQKQKEAERTDQKEQFEMEMENIGNSMKETPPRAQFFLGNGTKSNSARQLPIGGANANFRPILRERVYSIQERMVDKALAFMRMGGGSREEEDEEGGCCILKNPTKGPTGSRLLERRRMSCAKRGVAGTAKATTTEEEETETTTPTTPTNNIV